MANARARMLSWTISRDERVHALSCPYARLLYTWMIAHADNLGRMPAEAHEILATVLPRDRSLRPAQIDQWLVEMDQLGLICLFTSGGMRYLEFMGWKKHQNLVGNMRRTSDFPNPPEDVYTACERRSNTVCLKGREERGNRSEGEGEKSSLVQRAENLTHADPALNLPGIPKPVSKAQDSRDWAAAFAKHFWPKYPRKVARAAALKAWAKIPPSQATITAICHGLSDWLDRHADKLHADPQFIPHASTWLNQRRWEDETP